MENPYLTYINVNMMNNKFLLFHEICHSWTGNLITNSTWENFWINEGFTTFLERKLVCMFEGEEYFKARSHSAYDNVCNLINCFGLNHNYTSLNPKLDNTDPMDAYSTVPYEKGYVFIKYLQELIGIDNFYIFLRALINKYKYKCIDYTHVMECYIEEVNKLFSEDKAEAILTQIDWYEWIFSTGLPLEKPLYNDI